LTYQLPATANTVREYQQITAEKGSNIYAVAEDFDVGVGEMLQVNPNLPGWDYPTGGWATPVRIIYAPHQAS
jgi:LysM repeat protein